MFLFDGVLKKINVLQNTHWIIYQGFILKGTFEDNIKFLKLFISPLITLYSENNALFQLKD